MTETDGSVWPTILPRAASDADRNKSFKTYKTSLNSLCVLTYG